MLIDTHCHLYDAAFTDDLPDVLDRAAAANVGHIFMPAINLDSLPLMDRLHHPDISFYKMAGLHPTEINEGGRIAEDLLLEQCEHDDIYGIGETGLDYYWSDEHKDAQKQSLRMHCRVAKQTQKPIILHNRASTDDLLTIIDDEQDGRLRGVWHCFNGSVEEGKRALDMGLLLGIGGITTFKNSGIHEAVAQLSLEKMMLETDAPYLAPAPKRGKRNEPSFVTHTGTYLAKLFAVDAEDLAAITTATAKQFFGI